MILLQMQALIQLSPQLLFNRIYKANKTTTTVSLDSLPCVLVSSIKKNTVQGQPVKQKGQRYCTATEDGWENSHRKAGRQVSAHLENRLHGTMTTLPSSLPSPSLSLPLLPND